MNIQDLPKWAATLCYGVSVIMAIWVVGSESPAFWLMYYFSWIVLVALAGYYFFQAWGKKKDPYGKDKRAWEK